jgi:hypothetical protein
MQGRIPPPSVVFKRTTSTPTHHCVRCHSQLADGKRNLVGPQDKLPLTPAGASTIVGPKSKWLKPSSKTLEETR